MFDSGIKICDLINEIKSDVSVALPVSDTAFFGWINSLQQMLYGALIRFQKKVSVLIPGEAIETSDDYLLGSKYSVSLKSLEVNNDEAPVSFKDIVHIYCGDRQLIRTSLISSDAFGNCYWRSLEPEKHSVTSECIGFRISDVGEADCLKVIYHVRPSLVKTENKDDYTLKLPVEFSDIAKSYLRYQTYMISNEFDIAANWLQTYNSMLETFKEWLGINYPSFGL